MASLEREQSLIQDALERLKALESTVEERTNRLFALERTMDERTYRLTQLEAAAQRRVIISVRFAFSAGHLIQTSLMRTAADAEPSCIPRNDRFFGNLESLRGVAALSVVFIHCVGCLSR